MEEGLSGRLTKRLENSTLKYFLQTITYAILGKRIIKMNYGVYAHEQ
jgi:hypothetical protein